MTGCLKLGLTGGIGCGKSAACAIFKQRGVPVFSTDACVHDLLASDANVREKIARRWGGAVLGADGAPNRSAIAARVFADKHDRLFLEKLLHPRVRAACAHAATAAAESGHLLFVAEIPLLFENGFDRMFDATACVWTSDETARARLRNRGLDDAQIAARRATQWPLAQKALAADYVVLNDGDVAFLDAQLRFLQPVLNLR